MLIHQPPLVEKVGQLCILLPLVVEMAANPLVVLGIRSASHTSNFGLS